MTLDLPTLLLTRVGVDVLISLAFWAQMRRYPAIGGPGWWSLAGVVSIVGTLGAGVPATQGGSLVQAMTSLFINASLVFLWVGMRSYLDLPYRIKTIALALLVMALLHLLVYNLHWAPGRFVLFFVVNMGVAVLVLRDLYQTDPQGRVPELRALRYLISLEFAGLLAVASYLLWSGKQMTEVLAPFLFVLLLTKMLRAVLYGALLSLRLRQDGDRARQSLATREAQARALIENLGAGVVVCRPDRSTVTANQAARRFFGWPEDAPDAVPPTTEWQLLREDGSLMPRHELPFERVLASGLPVSDVLGGIRTGEDGAVRWALCNAYPENDAIGGLRHVVFTFVDITSLKQAQGQQRALEQQLALSHKMEALGTLAGGVAHDFNNILAAILGNADLARQDLEQGAPARESLHEISSAARRGRELVRQILAFSRQQPLERTPVSLREIVSETTSLLRTALTPQIQLSAEVSTSTPAIRADATQLGQVLLNLGTNAIHALEGRPGHIHYQVQGLDRLDPRLPPEVLQACTEADVDAVCVSVSDDGCGMSEATQQRIFEPFFTTKAVGRGTGLGLPVVLGIVQAHGGAIRVSSAPGQGTTFHLYFPAATSRQGRPDPEPAALPGTMPDTVTPTAGNTAHPEERTVMAEATAAAQRHILYLDDDDTLVFLVRRLLERRGYKVSAFIEQQQALAALRADPRAFDLLMTDYNMPGMSGIEVARAALAIRADLPVAVASGYISDELQAEASAAGVTEVVFKTDAVEAFCEVVARLVTPKN